MGCILGPAKTSCHWPTFLAVRAEVVVIAGSKGKERFLRPLRLSACLKMSVALSCCGIATCLRSCSSYGSALVLVCLADALAEQDVGGSQDVSAADRQLTQTAPLSYLPVDGRADELAMPLVPSQVSASRTLAFHS